MNCVDLSALENGPQDDNAGDFDAALSTPLMRRHNFFQDVSQFPINLHINK